MNLTKGSFAYIDAHQGIPYYEQTPEEARAERAASPIHQVSVGGISKIEDRLITVSDGAQISVRIYTPEGNGPFPIIVYYHGGGWVFGNPDYADGGCRYLTASAHSIVISVDYRLAPEFPFPIPVQDSYDAFLWAVENASTLHGNASKMYVAGDSAGGNIAAVVSQWSVAKNGPKIAGQALIYPVTNTNFNTSSYEKFGKGYGLDRDGMIWFTKQYIGDSNESINPSVSPLLAEDFQSLPRTILIAAEYDVLLDEGIAYITRLRECGVEAKHILMPGLIHSYFSKMEFFEEDTKKTTEWIADFFGTKKS
ncbi:alpha/beta hydrolase [Rummeliibacillus pycnus]|uniref:alpha/beta hydrolase n=1 Tax=Rummeliibacillus pycnus TaxID=101070 RepID=UPI000C9C74E4|nr:alpha/beta hydrolase [Rummeliibacillus pycnus]